MLEILQKKFPSEKFPPVIVHLFYILISITFCMMYNHWIISKSSFYTDDYGGIYKVLNMEAIRSIQYRVLVPLIFKLLKIITPLPDTAAFLVIIVIFTYFTTLSFYFILNIYFENAELNYILAPVIFYPMVWNFMLLNSIFFFVDNTILFFLTLGLYLVLSGKNIWLLVIFFFGALNHYSIGFILLTFVLFNLNRLFKKDVIVIALTMTVIYIGCFAVMKILFPYFPVERDDGFVAWIPDKAIAAIVNLPKHILIRNLIFNFGGLHVFALLFVLCGIWKKVKRNYFYIFLLIILYILLALLRLGIRVEEMRNWIPLIPYITVLALMFLSQLKNPFLRLSALVKQEKNQLL